MKTFRTDVERRVGREIERIFLESLDSVEVKLENFPKYVRRQHLKRFLAMYEIFKMLLTVKGSIVDCGIYRGFSLMAWAKLSGILEPENLTRRIYGFDTFQGFPSVHEKDQAPTTRVHEGEMRSDSYHELSRLIEQYDADRFLGHIQKVHLIPGDATQTIPKFVRDNQQLLVSLLFLDFDLHGPTKVALEQFVPRIPRGGIIAFDELDNPIWPGETTALLETVGIRQMRLQRIEWDPYITYAVIE